MYNPFSQKKQADTVFTDSTKEMSVGESSNKTPNSSESSNTNRLTFLLIPLGLLAYFLLWHRSIIVLQYSNMGHQLKIVIAIALYTTGIYFLRKHRKSSIKKKILFWAAALIIAPIISSSLADDMIGLITQYLPKKLNTKIVTVVSKPYRSFYHSTKRQNNTYYSLIYSENHHDYRINTYNSDLMKIKRYDHIKITYANTAVGRYVAKVTDLYRDNIDLKMQYIIPNIY